MTQEQKDQIQAALPDLVERHFPKGECQERGAAMVLAAEILMLIKAQQGDFEARDAISRLQVLQEMKKLLLSSFSREVIFNHVSEAIGKLEGTLR